MFGLFCFVLAVLASAFKSKSRLEAENAALRHQLIVLRRKMRGRIRLTNNDRGFLSSCIDSPVDFAVDAGAVECLLSGKSGYGADFTRGPLVALSGHG